MDHGLFKKCALAAVLLAAGASAREAAPAVAGGRLTAAPGAPPAAPARAVGGGIAVCSDDPSSFVRVARTSASALRPASPAEIAQLGALVATRPEIGAAAAAVAPMRIELGQPRYAATTFGWVGVSYPLTGAAAGAAGRYALWFDASREVAGEMVVVQRAESIAARIVVDRQVVFADTLYEPDASADEFWECLKRCTHAVLDNWVYTFIRAVCTRVCTPVTPYCAACVIALSALEAGMISGCVHDCSMAAPGSGSWGRPGPWPPGVAEPPAER